MSKEILAAFNPETGTWDVVDEDDFYDMDKPEEALQKAYKKGRTDAFTQILMYLNDASLAQSGKCHDCTQELMEIIEKMEGEEK